MPDFGLLAVLLAWVACIAVWVVKLAPLAGERPILSFWVGIAPAGLGLLMASLSLGQNLAGDDCGLMRLTVFLVERARFTGFLATGCLWLGALPLVLSGRRNDARAKIFTGGLFAAAIASLAMAQPALRHTRIFLQAVIDPGQIVTPPLDWMGLYFTLPLLACALVVSVVFGLRTGRGAWRKLLPLLLALAAMAVLDAGTRLMLRDQYQKACLSAPAEIETPA